MKKKIKDLMVINLGLFIMAAGIYLFLVPANLAVGGVTGLAMILQSYFPVINLGLLMLFFNTVLFILAFFVIGKEFAFNSIYCSLLLSGIIGVFELIVPMNQPIVDDLMLNLIYGILIQGVGMAIVFYQNASTGGTDILAKIINIYTNIEIGKALFLADSVITLIAGLTFGPELGLYAFLGILVNGIVIDNVISGISTKIQVMIISNRTDLINDFIQNELDRGTTFFYGEGGYSKERKEIINAILTRREYMKLKHFIKDNDPTAFISMNIIHEVLGEGFDMALQAHKKED